MNYNLIKNIAFTAEVSRGPRAACGPPDVFVRPATSLKLLKQLVKLWFL